MLDLNAQYEIMSFTVGDTKAGTKMGKMQLKNLSDESVINCILWEEVLNRTDPKSFKTANVIKVTQGSFNEKFNNCLIASFEVIKEAKAGLNKEEREEAYNKIIECINGFEDEKIKKFTLDIISKNQEAFKVAPAAKLMHHNYVGGLIQHIKECVEYARAVYPLFVKKINKDEMFSAVILHDIGKIFEYKIDLETGLIDYNEEFRKDWITHSQYGYSLCMSYDFKNIAKMIAAHHGRADWGAIIDLNGRDLEPMVYLTHHIDDLSAKFGKTSINDIK